MSDQRQAAPYLPPLPTDEQERQRAERIARHLEETEQQLEQKNMQELQIKFKGATLSVSGHHRPQDNEFEIVRAMHKGADVEDLVSAFDGWEEIEKACLQHLAH